MLTFYLRGVGEVSFYRGSLYVVDATIYARTNEGKTIAMDKMSPPDESPEECGWCHLVEYDGQSMSCYVSIH